MELDTGSLENKKDTGPNPLECPCQWVAGHLSGVRETCSFGYFQKTSDHPSAVHVSGLR